MIGDVSIIFSNTTVFEIFIASFILPVKTSGTFFESSVLIFIDWYLTFLSSLSFDSETINIEPLIVNATRAQRRLIISETELEVEGLELFNGSPIKAEIKAKIGEIEIKIKREQNKIHIENDGVETEIRLELNDRIRIENNQLILNKSGVERVLTVLPIQAMNQLKATNLTITNMSLITEQERSVYKVNEKRKAKILGLIQVELDVESK